MNWKQKLAVYIGHHNYRHLPATDDLINEFIEHGEYAGICISRCTATVRYKGAEYECWIENRWYADLHFVREKSTGRDVYACARPSAKTRIRFFEWLEKCDPDNCDWITHTPKHFTHSIHEIIGSKESVQ